MRLKSYSHEHGDFFLLVEEKKNQNFIGRGRCTQAKATLIWPRQMFTSISQYYTTCFMRLLSPEMGNLQVCDITVNSGWMHMFSRRMVCFNCSKEYGLSDTIITLDTETLRLHFGYDIWLLSKFHCQGYYVQIRTVSLPQVKFASSVLIEQVCQSAFAEAFQRKKGL